MEVQDNGQKMEASCWYPGGNFFSVFLRNRLLTACTFSLSSHAKAQEFVNVLNMVM